MPSDSEQPEYVPFDPKAHLEGNTSRDDPDHRRSGITRKIDSAPNSGDKSHALPIASKPPTADQTQAEEQWASDATDIRHQETHPEGWFALFHKEWRVVRTAPWSFVICVTIVSAAIGFIVYKFIEYTYSAEIRAKDATIQTLSLRPESVPAQEQELKELRIEIAKLKADSSNYISAGPSPNPKAWPALTDAQISEWCIKLKSVTLNSFVVSYRDERSLEFGVSLIKVAEMMRWPRQIDTQAAVGPGITIYCNKEDPAVSVIAGLLESAGYAFNIDPQFSQPGSIQITIGVK